MPDTKQYEAIPFSDELFPIKILWNFQPEKSSASHQNRSGTWHEQLEILYMLSGKVRVDCGFRRYICEPGDIVIVNPCEAHLIQYHSGDPSYHCLMVDSKFYDSGMLDLCRLKYMMPMNGRHLRFNNLIHNNPRVSSILQELIRECKNQDYAYEVAAKGHFLCLLAELFRSELSSINRSEKVISDKTDYDLIAPVFHYVAENYTKKITLDELSSLCCVNSSHLCRVFKKITGKTVIEYLNEYRLSKVHLLLLTTNKSIGEIAAETGFSDMGYLSRRFKALHGFSPIKLREMVSRYKKE